MNIFLKLDSTLDFNNSFTIKKVVSILSNEFDNAIKSDNIQYANSIIQYTRKMYDKFSSTYKESQDYGETMSFMQKSWANKIRGFISYMAQKSKKHFGIKNYETEIEHTIR